MNSNRRFHGFAVVTACIGALVLATALQAAAPPRLPELQAETGPLELIVLLAAIPGAPTPEAIVAGFSRQQLLRGNPTSASATPQPLPGSLGTGSPVRVYYALPERAQGEALEQLRAEPNGLRAILERYLVLSYPPGTDLAAVKAALAADPNILHVEENLQFEMAVTPTDPYFGSTNPPDPTRYQWGSHTLQLDQAWNWTTGHAYVGLTDIGLQMNHPDLQGNFRPQFSRDLAYCSLDPNVYPGQCDNNVDEVLTQTNNGIQDRAYYWDSVYQVRAVTQPPAVTTIAGHGTHTSGIVAATANNGIGVAGACWNCSLMMAKVEGLSGITISNTTTYTNTFNSSAIIASGIVWLVDHGAQVISSSLGIPNAMFQSRMGCADTNSDQRFNQGVFCNALAYMDQRDVTMFASSGNDELDLQFPASDSRVISVGGIDSTGAFWQPYAPGTCPSGVAGDCGSNYSVTWPGSPNFPQQPGKQILVAPALSVVSTIYQGKNWIAPNMGNPNPCYDSLGGGYGVCTGTSMSSPYAAGVGALVRSANPLLTKANVADILERTASNGLANWNQRTGYGIPNASAAVQLALGTVGGRVLVNRLTPLFSFYSSTATDSFYTTAPQMATAALFDPEVLYGSTGPQVPLYANFPGVTACTVSPCPPPRYPGASVYIFTTEYAPYVGAPPLVPLYRLSYRGTFNGNVHHRDTTYTTTSAGLAGFQGVGYKLDGIEGYIYSTCTPEPQCIPNGAVRLYRLYNPNLDDWAIFPESELAQKQAAGYQHSACCNDVIGYVYPNLDTDGDGLIDGFELLIGTNPRVADSDCDGVGDGIEVLTYPYDDPLGAGCGGPPVANFTFTCTGLACSFDASSTSSTAGITAYAWTFGDTTSGSGVRPSHTYMTAGTFTVTLTVTDKILRQSTVQKAVTAASTLPPCATSCTCTSGCYVNNCSVNGLPATCGDWGICQYSCYCGGDC